ncbi:MAG: sensor histidine kinase [Propionibacteriaceae bacterium]|nr:sensor histidine kinase [Propionibacteriaceae bacterium]
MLRVPSAVRPHVALGETQAAFLEALTDDWHILADLSFSDIVLWVPGIDDQQFYAIAQIRPATGPAALEDDVVGECISYDPAHMVTQAYLSQKTCQMSDNKIQAGIPADVKAVPLMVDCSCWGVLERHTNMMGVHASGDLEDNYRMTAEILFAMASRGEFPDPGHTRLRGISPRVGEGLILLDPDAVVAYASPNAVTAYRNLGLTTPLVGEDIIKVTSSLMEESGNPVDTHLAGDIRSIHSAEVEISTREAALFLRIIPLTSTEGRVGTVVVCRETTEIREKERQLVTKDATIREIHHRVKNNLQTVSALLRLQARRMSSPEATTALEEAMARVQAIAVVHEILSQSMPGSVVFDDIADRLLKLTADVASVRGHLETTRQGSFGEISAEKATHLALVITELCHNAIEHGLSSGTGKVTLQASRFDDGRLEIEVIDNGTGLPEDFDIHDPNRKSLGLSIVSTLIADMDGEFDVVGNTPPPGARARVRIPL